MWRAFASLFGLVCFAALFAETIAVGVLFYRGRLEPESLAAIGAVLAGQIPEAEDKDNTDLQVPQTSAAEVETARSLHTLELNARADDLRLLKNLLTSEAERLREDRAAYEQARAEFEQRLDEVRARETDEATEQTRLVVKAMPSREALVYLMNVPEPDGLRILKGLPERTVAKILQEFSGGTDEERQRGRSLFEALSAARPEADLTDAARAALPRSPDADADG